jgi:hypothetical protein
MKTNNQVLIMLVAGLLVGGCAGQTVQESGTQAVGVIWFAQDVVSQEPVGKVCSTAVPAAGGNAKQFKMDGCGNDVATYFKFENVPSSTVVTLISERSCSYGGDWWFDVRAIKHPTTSLWYDIRKLKHKLNTVVTPGVMRLGGKDHESIEGKLSCAVIRSPSK